MNRSEFHKLNRLLSGGSELSPQEKETMLNALLGPDLEAAPKRKQHPLFNWRLLALPIGAAAALAVFLLWGTIPSPEIPPGFTVRGDKETGAFRIECIEDDGAKGPCTTGNTIIFGVRPPETATHFSAASLDENGKLIRYFPSNSETSLPVSHEGILSRGIEISNEHQPGQHRIFGIFSNRPLDVDEIKDIIETYSVDKNADIEGVVGIQEHLWEVTL